MSLPAAAQCLTTGTGQRFDPETETLIPTIGGGFDVAHTLKGEGFDASEDGAGRGTPLVPVAFDTYNQNVTGDVSQTLCSRGDSPGGNSHLVPAIAFSCKDHGADAGEIAPTLRSMNHDGSHANGGGQVAVAVGVDGYNGMLTGDIAATMGTRGSSETASAPQVMQGMAVRRLTPMECERLQGFADGYTAIPWRGKDADTCPDGPRYKALGNSMAVPVMAWVGRRIAAVAAQALQAAA